MNLSRNNHTDEIVSTQQCFPMICCHQKKVASENVLQLGFSAVNQIGSTMNEDLMAT